MSAARNSFKLILAGNTNVPAMINAIIRGTIQARSDSNNDSLTFRQVHIFHTEQSLQALTTTQAPWQKALDCYGIHVTSIVHHIVKIEDSNVERFRDLVEQLRTIVNPLDNANYYVDLTGGISALKTILAVFAYVLDIEHIYSLEVHFSDDPAVRKREWNLFYNELEQEEVKIDYRKFPPIREFDDFGKLNYTEVLRYRHVVDDLTHSLALLLPIGFDLGHLRESLLSGFNSRLIGEVSGESYNYRHSVFSLSSGVEEMANVILTILKNADIENKTLGQKLGEVRDLFANGPKYFINTETLEHLTKLITEIRNSVVHPTNNAGRNQESAIIQSRLSSQLALTFFQFTIKSLSAFLDQNGELVNVQLLEPSAESDGAVFYFGFDGDATGDYLETAFGESSQDEAEVSRRSQTVHKAIMTLRKIIFKETKNQESILFAEGDNVLFKAKYSPTMLGELQRAYKEQTGLSSSIGYGKTLREARIAMRLAKAQRGDSCLGISIQDPTTKKPTQPQFTA
jgi:hypothetical protein